jgi:hypothetical protein
MDEDGGRLLRGRIERVATFQAVNSGGGDPAELPKRNAAMHGVGLLEQLRTVVTSINARELVRDSLAVRELVTITPAAGHSLEESALRVLRQGAVRVANVLANGAFVLDTADAHLPKLQQKIADFASVTKVTKHKDGSTTSKPNNAKAIAAIETIELATFADIASESLRTIPQSDIRAYWMEIECRGGYLSAGAENDRSGPQKLGQ